MNAGSGGRAGTAQRPSGTDLAILLSGLALALSGLALAYRKRARRLH
ncbi:MAG: hypothetical protein ABI140_02375 [Jatrophihabitantaceae bacterium]